VAAAAVLAVAGILVAVNRHRGDDPDRSLATGASTTTSSSSVATTEPPATSTSVARPTTTNRTTSTTAVRRTTIAPTTTKGPGPTASTTTTLRSRACTDAQIEVTAASDKARYGPGETVTATISLRNKSASTCSFSGYSLNAQILDPSGKAMAGFGVVADPLPGTDAPLAPGQVIRHSGPWDQRVCGEPACGRAPADTAYTISARWVFAGLTYSVTTTFVLV